MTPLYSLLRAGAAFRRRCGVSPQVRGFATDDVKIDTIESKRSSAPFVVKRVLFDVHDELRMLEYLRMAGASRCFGIMIEDA